MKPQMSAKEIGAIESLLLSYGLRVDVLEWGSGGSTVYFTQFLRNKGVSYTWTSIEYNKIWYERIKDLVRSDKNISLILVDVGNTELKQRSIPMNEYVAYPAVLGKKYDVILVDGRKRRRCLVEASKLLKPNGTVLLHDARRTYYHCAFSIYLDSQMLLWSGLWQGRLENPGFVQRAINLILYGCFRVYTFSFRLIRWSPIRYLISGGSAATVNLILLFVLVHFFYVWYLLAAIVTFIAGICVSLIMQKYFTFKDYTKDKITQQTTFHLGLQIFNLGLNTLLMYISVGMLHIHYIIAQVLIAGTISVYSFFIYKHLVFTPDAIYNENT